MQIGQIFFISLSNKQKREKDRGRETYKEKKRENESHDSQSF